MAKETKQQHDENLLECRRCRKQKPHTEFYTAKTLRGYELDCKKCKRQKRSGGASVKSIKASSTIKLTVDFSGHKALYQQMLDEAGREFRTPGQHVLKCVFDHYNPLEGEGGLDENNS